MQSLRNHMFYICELGCCFITFDKVCLNTVWTRFRKVWERTFKKQFILYLLLFTFLLFHFWTDFPRQFWGFVKDFSLRTSKVIFLKTENIFCCWLRQIISVLSQGLCQYNFLKSDYCVSEFDCHHTLNVIQSESVF